MLIILFLFACLPFIMAESVSQFKSDCGMIRVVEYWPEVESDLTKVVWSHATNSVSSLESALSDNTMMIEADVSLGENGTPIMAHPPDTTSDLSLKEFILRVKEECCTERCSGNVKKGMKLDFKSIGVVEESVGFIASNCDGLQVPIWLNADILDRSHEPSEVSKAVDADSFLAITNTLMPSATLSLGFTTTCSGDYSSSDFDHLIDYLVKYNITQPLTVPLRACLLARSGPAVLDFFEKAANSTNIDDVTITVWSGIVDVVDIFSLAKVLADIGKHRYYLDVPIYLETPLKAISSPSGILSGILSSIL